MAERPTVITKGETTAIIPGRGTLTVVSGTTTLASVVSDGKVAKLTEQKTKFEPKAVIDYAPGAGANYQPNIDPRFILPGENTIVHPGSKFWSLGRNGWIVLGFPDGFPASLDYRLRLIELGEEKEWVDFYVAKDIDPGCPAKHDPPYTTNGVFGDKDASDTNAYRQATPEETRPGDPWPAWIPREHWLYLGWIQGQRDSGQLTLANIPYGNYFYLLLHDRRAIASEGADVHSIEIIQNDRNVTDLYILLTIDNSLSAKTELAEYHNTIKLIIANSPFNRRRVRVGVRMIEDARKFRAGYPRDLERLSYVRSNRRSEAAITTRRLRFATGSEASTYWKLLDLSNINDVIKEICDNVTMDRLTSPILGALSAIGKGELKELTVELAQKTCELRIILITDGLPDSYNDYGTPADLSSVQRAAIEAQVKGAIKNKLEEIRPGLFEGSFWLVGQYGDNKYWLETIWNELGIVSVLRLADPKPAPANMHTQIPHTDCLNGGQESGRRIGAGENHREVLGQPSRPLAWKP